MYSRNTNNSDSIHDDSLTDNWLHMLHTGHYVFDTESQENSGDNSSLLSDTDSENRPPCYSFEELTRNLVDVSYGQPYGWYNDVSVLSSSLSSSTTTHRTSHQALNGPDKQKDDRVADVVKTPSETISQRLTSLITKDSCYVCNQNAKKTEHLKTIKHYKQTGHFKKVREWIERELAKVKERVDQKLIYCPPCNLPLSGNEKAHLHYLEKSHVAKANSYCTLCERVMNATDMKSHKQSKLHLKKLQTLNAIEEKHNSEFLTSPLVLANQIDVLNEEEPEPSEVKYNSKFLTSPLVLVNQIDVLNEREAEPSKVKIDRQETKETSKLTNLELQRLVMLEHLELIRIMKEKERILLNRLLSETTREEFDII